MVIIRAQQNFEIADGLNPLQIEIGNGRILSMFKKYKILRYRLTLLGLLFPTSKKNDTTLNRYL